MAKYATDDTIEFAGDYFLPNVVLHNHEGEGLTPDKKGHDIKAIMQELNIYESIYKSGITGSVVINDATNIVGNLPIQGTETLSFRLSTPNVTTPLCIINATQETGQPFHIYKLADKQQLSEGMQLFTLHFGSREFMRNLRTKVSQAYNGNIAYQVIKILMDENYLDSKKKLYYEPTGNTNKFVVPNLNPFAAINMIAKRSVADKSNGVGYYFYETTKGFHFRSWASMITNQGEFARPPKQQFYYQPLRMGSNSKATDQDKIEREYESVESYEFVNNFHDVASNTALGTYGHRVISHNLFDKSYDIADYNFHNEYRRTPHTDTVGYGSNNMFPVMDTPVDYDNVDNASDYPESRVSLQTTTPFLHDKDVGTYGLDADIDGEKTGQGISQNNQIVNGTALRMTVKGQSYIQAGDLITFNLRDVNLHHSPEYPDDPRFSGNYIITKVRHQVTKDQYKMILECAKDSVATSYQDLAPNPHLNVHETSRSFELEEIDGDIGY